jgi:hypothetical protein
MKGLTIGIAALLAMSIGAGASSESDIQIGNWLFFSGSLPTYAEERDHVNIRLLNDADAEILRGLTSL